MYGFVFATSIPSLATMYDSWPDQFLAIQMVNVEPALYTGVQSFTFIPEKLGGSIKYEGMAIGALQTPKHHKQKKQVEQRSNYMT